jgi:DnaA regulatory inactivator Hda
MDMEPRRTQPPRILAAPPPPTRSREGRGSLGCQRQRPFLRRPPIASLDASPASGTSRAMQDMRQLPLPFQRGRDFAPGNFHEAASNTDALAWLARTADWPDLRLALWGPAGCGKTHLLHMWAQRRDAVVWRGTELSGLPDLPATGGIALDDADALADETALFHLLNAATEEGLPVLLASRAPPSLWPVQLPDLASRVRSINAVEIGPPDDALMHVLLARLLAERQLRPSEAVHNWLLRRLPRTQPDLAEAVARLDAVSMELGRDITIPLARDVLGDVASVASDEISGTRPSPSREDPPLL